MGGNDTPKTMSDKADKIIMHGPFRVKMEVMVTNGDGTDGEVTYDMPPWKYPDADAYQRALEQVEACIGEAGLRLMDKREAWDFVLNERGVATDDDGETIRFAMPGGKDWDPS